MDNIYPEHETEVLDWWEKSGLEFNFVKSLHLPNIYPLNFPSDF